MNIIEFEKLERNPTLADKLAQAMYLAAGRARDPKFSAMWSRVSQDERIRYAKAALDVILHALVDDYTTPGCDCEFCTWEGDSVHGRPIMCEQQWKELPMEQRMQISESVAG